MVGHVVTLDDTYAAVIDSLDQLARLNGERMTRDEDITYQTACSWAAPVASILGRADLATRLDIAAMTCHHCDP